MSLEQTQQTIDHYFDVMTRGGDFAVYYTDDVTWTMTDTGDEVRGPSSVRDYIVGLHNNMLDAHTPTIVVSDGHAYIEGDCQALTGSSSRIPYCVTYDIVDGRITAMRCYGPIGDMAPTSRAIPRTAKHAAKVANIRVSAFQLERPGETEKVSITIINNGPAVARNIDLAVLDSEDRAKSAGLGDVVEATEHFGGYAGKSRLCYFQIPWGLPLPRPLDGLEPGHEATFPFWHRYRFYGMTGMRVTWEDERGIQILRCMVPFNAEPAWRF
jgi:ketosteroid isomerase-like protein